MARVKGKNTKPELIVRRMVHGMGHRYRLHEKDLLGKPDLVFKSKRKIIFVHGCFWHGHDCRAGRNHPASNLDYWNAKLERNMKRDANNLKTLKREGWRVLIIWECEIKDAQKLRARLERFLSK